MVNKFKDKDDRAIVYLAKDSMPDIYNSQKNFYRYLKKMRSWGTLPTNKKTIEKFLKRKMLEGMGFGQLIRYLYALKIFVKVTNSKAFETVQESDLENFLLEMREMKITTRKKNWYCVKKFLEYTSKSDLYDNFRVTFKTDKLRPKEEIWNEEEMEKLIDEGKDLKEKTFAALMTEGGYRIGEILTANVKNVEFTEQGCKIIVEGKTGWRNPLLVTSCLLLRDFIKNKNKEERIFDISYARAINLMRRLAKRSNVNKRINQQIIRASAATRDAKWLTDSQLCLKYGWDQGSKTSRTYVRMSGRDLDFAILRMHGLEKNDEFEKHKKMGIG